MGDQLSPSATTGAFSARFDTDDPDRAKVLLRRYAGAEVELIPTRSAFRFRSGTTGDADVSLQSSAISALVSGPFDFGDQYVVLWLTAGAGSVGIGGFETPLTTGRPVMLPPGRVVLHLDDARQNHVHFRADFLDRVAADAGMPGSAPSGSIAGAVPADEQLAGWTASVRTAAVALLEPVASMTGRARRACNRELAEATVRTFPRWAPVPAFDRPVRAPRVQRAMDYIEASAGLPISTEDIAAAVGLSARGLQQAFQRDLSTTPHDYLRNVRLGNVRRDLLRSSIGRASSPARPYDSVSTTAARWGFVHLGRFSAAYRARFDELPSATLRG
ncbi:helix-turn-helix transcriptional regulator [Curtobacterium sp. Leaf261]|uniref:helix-turn-helix transcriptional regulator n=1 Tax=Curtobacterium sp. Leaf261 TaxID=1736311 RepID=UPI0006FFE5BB|nr:helix-turn-helix transcriptional regulator [Curtobacterium sp. Leaf261]KQO64882.1 hypothetical protein ASF23_01500 [Curtobacterium sp. Leaf261]